MRNICFFTIQSGVMKPEEEFQGLVARDPEGAVLSTYGFCHRPFSGEPEGFPIERHTIGEHGETAQVFWLQEATRAIDKEVLWAAVDEARAAKRGELERDLTHEEDDNLREAVILKLSADAPIVRKITRAILYSDGLLAVEANNYEAGRRVARFIARCFETEDGEQPNVKIPEHLLGVVGPALNEVVRNVDFLDRFESIEIGSSIQIKDRDTKTTYTVKQGDLRKPEVKQLLDNPDRFVERISLLCTILGEDENGYEALVPFVEFNLHKDGCLKGTKWIGPFSDDRATFCDGANSADADTLSLAESFVTAKYVAILYGHITEMMKGYLGVDEGGEE